MNTTEALLATATIESPCGELHLFADDTTLVAVLWVDEDGDATLRRPSKQVQLGDHPILREAARQLGEYFEGVRTDFDLPLGPSGTEFQLAAWQALTKIPYGETRSYAFQANVIGRPTAVRAVGAANGRNKIPIIIPCHRVIGSNGSLTGFAAGVDTKRWLLDHERRVIGASPALF